MAVAKDATSLNKTNDIQTTVTVSHTATGTNRLLLIGACYDFSDVDRSITSVTYNSVDCTYAGAHVHSNNQTSGFEELWYMKEADMPTSPATANIVVTYNVADAAGKSVYAISLTGVDQTTPLGTPVTNYGSTTTPTVTVSSASGNMVVDFICDGGAFSACAQTPNYVQQGSSGVGAGYTGLSWQAGGASVTNSWTYADDWWASIGVDVKADGGGGATGGLMWL